MTNCECVKVDKLCIYQSVTYAKPKYQKYQFSLIYNFIKFHRKSIMNGFNLIASLKFTWKNKQVRRIKKNKNEKRLLLSNNNICYNNAIYYNKSILG